MFPSLARMKIYNPLTLLGTGDLFGEDICQPKKKIKCSNGDVKALMYCEILYLTRDGIRDVISCYSDFPKHFSRNIVLAFDLSRKKVLLTFYFLLKITYYLYLIKLFLYLTSAAIADTDNRVIYLYYCVSTNL